MEMVGGGVGFISSEFTIITGLRMAKKLAALDVNKCIGCMECMFACSRRVGKCGFDKSAIKVRSAGGNDIYS